MSRTDKDRPHWVREREFGVEYIQPKNMRTLDMTPLERQQYSAKMLAFWQQDDCGESLFGRGHKRQQRRAKKQARKKSRQEARRQARNERWA